LTLGYFLPLARPFFRAPTELSFLLAAFSTLFPLAFKLLTCARTFRFAFRTRADFATLLAFPAIVPRVPPMVRATSINSSSLDPELRAMTFLLSKIVFVFQEYTVRSSFCSLAPST